MKGIFWNSRGLADLAKYRYIAESNKENNLDFIAILKTGKQDLSRSTMTRLSGGVDFIWHCLPPRGRSGGILLGVKASSFDLSLSGKGSFFIKFHLTNRADKFKWILMA